MKIQNPKKMQLFSTVACIPCLSHEMAFARWDHTLWQFRRNRPSLLNDSITQKHGHYILLMIKQTISIHITQVPDLSQLVLVQSCLDQNITSLGGGKVSAFGTQGLKTLSQTVRRILECPDRTRREQEWVMSDNNP